MEIPPTPADALWRGTARQTRDDERRQRLVDAALEVYGTRGYRLSTVQSVCQLAAVSTRSFYELFVDQEELLGRLYDDLRDEVLQGIVSVTVDPSHDVFTAVRGVVAAALGPALADERKARVMEIETVGVSELLEQRRRLTIRQLASAVDGAFAQLADAGKIEPMSSPMTSMVLVGGISSALMQRAMQEPVHRLPPATFLDEVTSVIVRAAG